METKEINEWVKAGGYVLPSWDLPEVTTDVIDARIYEHPAIPQRSIVRLCASALSGGSDSAMEVLGFSFVNSVDKIAIRARQALGFPETILITHPEHARLALETNKKLKRIMARAASKPGRVKEDIFELSSDLEMTNPHFLPSFFEEAGRYFVASGNTSYGGQFFGKARDAEQKYALEVDEGQRMDAFLEFALMGALTSKVMSDYSKVLTTKHGTSKAYEYYFKLCVRRTLGGGPPSVQMANDLKRLVRACKLDPEQEAVRFVSEVAEAPALLMAPPKFWADYENAFARACELDPRLKGVLLNLVPKTSGEDESFGLQWLGFLRKTGALNAVLCADKDSVAPELQPHGSAAEWLDSWLAFVNPNGWNSDLVPDEVFEFLKEMAPRLKADGVPLHLERVRGDADILDWCLELEIPVSNDVSINLQQWATGRHDSIYRRRDLQYIADSEVFQKQLNGAVRSVVSDMSFQVASKGKSGLHSAKERWLESCVEELQQAFWPSWAEQAQALTESVSVSLFAEFPKHYELLRDFNPVPSLLRSIHAGLMQEIGWKPFDDAILELTDPRGEIEVEIDGAFPYAIVHNGKKAIVVGPEGRVLEHTFVFNSKKDARIRFVRYSAGQLLVVFDLDWESKLYWSGKPKSVADSEHYWRSGPEFTVVMQDGRVFDGIRAWGPPETDIPEAEYFVSDGTSFWRIIGWDDDAHMVEIHPETGQFGRASIPEFYERFARPGYRIAYWDSHLFPVPFNPDSILETTNGLWGIVALEDSNHNREFFLQSGEKTYSDAVGKIRFPGASQDTTLFREFKHGEPVISFQEINLNWPFFFLMAWRDEEASRVLRQAEENDVASWFLQALERRREGEDTFGSKSLDLCTQKLHAYGTSAKPLPLAETLSAFMDGAADCVIELANALDLTDPSDVSNAEYSYRRLAESLLPLGIRYYSHYGDRIVAGRVVKDLCHALKGGPLNAAQLEDVPSEFVRALLQPEILVWLGARSQHRSDFAQLFRHMASLEFGFQGSEGRVISLEASINDHGLDLEYSVEKLIRDEQEMIVFQWNDLIFQWSNGPMKDFKFTKGESKPWLLPSPELLEFWAELLDSEDSVIETSDQVFETLEKEGFMSPALARIVWNGMPLGLGWGRYSKDQLAMLGLKSRPANVAQEELRFLDAESVFQAIRESIQAEPNPFSPNAINALAQAWTRIEGYEPPPPPELVELLELLSVDDPDTTLKMIVDHDHPNWQIRDFKVVRDEWSEGYSIEFSNEVGLSDGEVTELIQALTELAHLAPPDHSIRQRLLPTAQKLRSCLEDERFIVSLGAPYGWVWDKDLEQQIQMLGIPTKGKTPFLDDGLTVSFNGGSGVEFHLRTASYLRGERNAHTEKVVKENDGDGDILKELDYLNSPGFQDLMKWGSGEVPGNPRNPTECVPELVDTVSSKLKLSKQAATLLLQTLALVDLKSATVKNLNGWSTKEYNTACSELLDAGLVIEAKRSRSGRKHFLDGPWTEYRSGPLPHESWKTPWIGSYASQLPTCPLPVLFQQAWERWDNGDRPGF